MKKKIVILFIFISISSFVGFMYYKYKLDYETVYIASHNISQRKKLDQNDLKEIVIPKSMINECMFTNMNDIVGKYVKLGYSIPNNSFIYEDALETNIKDLVDTLLKENEVTYDLFVSDIKMNTGHLNPNMYLDLYLTIDKGDKVISDLLLSNCRITGFFDSYGKQIYSYDLDSKIYIVSLAINKNDVSILNKALVLGTINCVVNNNTYDLNSKSTQNKNSLLYEYLI